MQDIYEKFEFQRIREEISLYTHSELANEMVLSLSMLPSKEEVEKELSFLSETIDALDRFSSFPIDVSSKTDKYLTLAAKGGCLSVEEIERIAHDIILSKDIRRYFKEVDSSPLLLEFVSKIPNLDYLEKRIHSVISPDLSIYDNASDKLASIRRAIRRTEAEMKKKLGAVLEENRLFLSGDSLTMRNGHYVLPVANAYKHRVKGMLQDVSSSGGTSFIEPEILVELNAKMLELRNEEREEIHRILLELSASIGSNEEDLRLINSSIAYLDFLSAKAQYSNKYHCHIATILEKSGIEFQEARHPLLDQSRVVPNDFYLNEKTSLVVISGPNAGGKTVALKTIGLLILMSQCGLAIPAHVGCAHSYFRNIYVDIGDSQSLSDNLSTFSGHMRNIGEILSTCGGKDLVLLDEVGTGTSPKEGEAIAFAVIKTLQKKHSVSLISSHFEGLKAYALSHQEITNASMFFDEENLEPTYRLKMGLPGESFGLIVAKRFGLPEETLSLAKEYLSNKEDLSVSSAIKKLAASNKEVEDLKKSLLEEQERINNLERQLKIREHNLSEKEKKLHDEVDKEKARLLEEYEDKL
ncbi:MAG: hypothetical protein K5694_01180, partial [Bacilli bacterium]|nr:hypothetical protein [Bacilli bacterium]